MDEQLYQTYDEYIGSYDIRLYRDGKVVYRCNCKHKVKDKKAFIEQIKALMEEEDEDVV